MAVRNIVKIDREKCDGCGLCVTACAEGAIQVIDGKAKLVSEVYCDGLGACLGHCPQDAITIEQREAAAFDEAATHQHVAKQKAVAAPTPAAGFVCPGMRQQQRKPAPVEAADSAQTVPSQLGQWPVQLKLVSPQAPYFAGADLLLAADCVAFAMGDFHGKLLKGRAVAIACPKLDDAGGYVEKLAEIIRINDLKSLTVARMQVPCCSGLTRLVLAALEQSGADLAMKEITISLEGQIIKEETYRAG